MTEVEETILRNQAMIMAALSMFIKSVSEGLVPDMVSDGLEQRILKTIKMLPTDKEEE